MIKIRFFEFAKNHHNIKHVSMASMTGSYSAGTNVWCASSLLLSRLIKIATTRQQHGHETLLNTRNFEIVFA
jgi:hypothetical protein